MAAATKSSSSQNQNVNSVGSSDNTEQAAAILKEMLHSASLVDKSHKGLQKSLVKGVLFAVVSDNLGLLSRYVIQRREISPDTVQTVSVEAWLTSTAELDIDKDTGIVSLREDHEYDRKWRDRVELGTTWYKKARDMQKFKPPVLATTSLATAIARTEVMGGQVDYDVLLEQLKSEVVTAKRGKAMKTYLEQARKEAKKVGAESLSELLEAAAA